MGGGRLIEVELEVVELFTLFVVVPLSAVRPETIIIAMIATPTPAAMMAPFFTWYLWCGNIKALLADLRKY